MKLIPDNNKKPTKDPSQVELIEGTHYYMEDGFFVLTEKYLADRGYCCENKCRHCPYPKK